MSTPKHTPGPWTYKTENEDRVSGTEAWGECHEIISTPSGDILAVDALFVGFVLSEEDARLIAAAPDLLKALEIIQAMAAPVSTLPWEKTPTVDFAKTMDAIAEQARAAIAKAMGT